MPRCSNTLYGTTDENRANDSKLLKGVFGLGSYDECSFKLMRMLLARL